nr:EOG090X0ARU [Macrothrix elegans]
MFRRKLNALGYPNPETFNSSDEKQFRNAIVWLEDQKIRRYKIEERELIRNTTTEDWNKAFEQYTLDLDCPFSNITRSEILDWLLSLAIQLEFNEKPEAYAETKKPQDNTKPTNTNPLDNLDFNSTDFVAGVNHLADLLQVPRHPNHLITLEGICNLIEEKFSQEALKEALKFKKEESTLQVDHLDFGFKIKEQNVSQAANALRFLFIHDLRGLQTKINECLVAVQALTADPKTDTKLGKVGF